MPVQPKTDKPKRGRPRKGQSYLNKAANPVVRLGTAKKNPEAGRDHTNTSVDQTIGKPPTGLTKTQREVWYKNASALNGLNPKCREWLELYVEVYEDWREAHINMRKSKDPGTMYEWQRLVDKRYTKVTATLAKLQGACR